MPALAEFEPLRAETVDTIRARIDANVNAGLDTADMRWQDTVPGGFFFDHTQAFAVELEGVYDYVSVELPASFFLPFSFGIYLDYWGDMLDLPRNPAAEASGEVTFTNTKNEPQLIAAGTEVAVPAADLTADPLVYVTLDTVEVPALGEVTVGVVAADTGTEFNVTTSAVSQILSPSEQLAVENEAPITGGRDEELDEPYKARLLLEFTGTRGGGTADDYIAGTLGAFPSVANVTVQHAWAGPNTVRLVISDVSNHPLSGPVVAEVQAYWDANRPLDAVVTVATVAINEVTIAGDLELEDGFTLDGSGGTVGLQDAIEAALVTYFDSLPPGQDVQHNRVMAAILSVDGVYDVATVTLDGVEADAVMAELDSAVMAADPVFTVV